MDINSVPEPSWKAGPDNEEVARNWRDALESAEEEIRDARRLYRDDIHAERRLRIEKINDAMQYLNEALVLLPNQAVKRG